MDIFLYSYFHGKPRIIRDFKPETIDVSDKKLLLNQSKDIVIFKGKPDHLHSKFSQYNTIMALSLLTFIAGQILIYNKFFYVKTKEKRMAKFFGCLLILPSIFEFRFAFYRIKDPSEIVLKQGKTLIIKSYQDKLPYELDIKNLYLLYKETDDFYLIFDRKNLNKFIFWAIEPSFASVYDMSLFKLVFEDNKYVRY